jgi:hypothetical protein
LKRKDDTNIETKMEGMKEQIIKQRMERNYWNNGKLEQAERAEGNEKLDTPTYFTPCTLLPAYFCDYCPHLQAKAGTLHHAATRQLPWLIDTICFVTTPCN